MYATSNYLYCLADGKQTIDTIDIRARKYVKQVQERLKERKGDD